MIFPGRSSDTGEPKPTALYAAAAAASISNSWTDVNGWTAARVFTSVEEEYTALTAETGVIDSSPLCRYTVRGYDSAALLARLCSAPVRNLAAGETARGLVLASDGAVVTCARVTRLSGDLFLLTVSEPIARRIQLSARGFEAEVENINGKVAAIILAGPQSYAAARAVGISIDDGAQAAKGRVRGVEIAAAPVQLGDTPGVEIIYPEQEALTLWDRVRRTGVATPVGLDALEIVRIESGAPRPGADFVNADSANGRASRRSPDEIGLPHLAPIDRGWFSGRSALGSRAENRRSATGRYLVAMAVDADAVSVGAAVFAGKNAAGRVTSAAFSPHLRRAICMAEIDGASVGKSMEIAAADPISPRSGANLLETAEVRLAAAFRDSLRAATDFQR